MMKKTLDYRYVVRTQEFVAIEVSLSLFFGDVYKLKIALPYFSSR
jgi:hypothetical protein